jgi:molybdopterin molybdotransferase
MITLQAALSTYADALQALPTRIVPTTDALNAVLAAPATAHTDLPRFDQSAMDGYTLRAADITAATPLSAIQLPIALHLPAGRSALAPLPQSTAARILTGAMLPEGADTVIPQEIANRIDNDLRFEHPYPAQRNIRRRGDELRIGAHLASIGQRIGPSLLASLINAEVDTVVVRASPRISVIISGDEIRPPGAVLHPGEIHDSNGPMVTALLHRWGYSGITVRHVGDNESAVRATLAEAIADSDLVISTGGASVGDKDYLPAVAEALGTQRIFWRVAQKPGKPIFFGVHQSASGAQCAVLALPGNPGAVLIGMLLHVRTALNVLEGLHAPEPHWQHGVLTEAVERDSDRTRLLRMQCYCDSSGTMRLQPLPHQDSHMLSNLGVADVVVRAEPGTSPVAAGSVLPWLPLPT